jgi:hypothetical protein
MNDTDLLKPYLDQAAAQMMWSRRTSRIDLNALRTALRSVLTKEGMKSMRVKAEHDSVLIDYFDAHGAFERVSDEPEWVLKVKRNPAVGR